MTTGKTLKQEIEFIDKTFGQIREDSPDAPVTTPDQKSALTDLEQQMYGAIHARKMPVGLSDELLRQKTGVPLHIWQDDEKYPPEKRGKIAAGHIIQTQLDLVERFHAILKRNKDKAKREAQSKNNKVAQAHRTRRNRKPKRVNRYRTRR